VLQILKQNICFTMSSSATTYFSNGTPGSSSSSGPLGYWSNQNYHFYQHYAYQNGGGIVPSQFPYQQHHGMTESGETVYQLHESENPRIHAPTDQSTIDTLAPNTKYSTNLPSISYSVVGFNQQQIPRKPTSSPSSLQSGLDISDEYFPNRYNLSSSTSPMFQNHYQQTNHGLGSPQPEGRMVHISRSPSPRRTDHDVTFPSINQQSVVEVKKESTSPILGMLLNRPNASKGSPSALSSVGQSVAYHEYYSPSGLVSPTASRFTNKDGSVEERDVALRHQYDVDARTSTSSKTTDSEELPSRQDFGNISPPQNQTEFIHNRFENRKLPLECMQPAISYGGDGGAKITSQIQQSSFYPWMKSYTGELLHLHHSCGHSFFKVWFNEL
jgi:hypothetical protein